VVLILGGSQGAKKINEIIINILPRLLEIAEIIHGCGKEDFKEIQKETQNYPDYHLYPFLDAEQLKHAFALADLIINRAGAGSIFEIAALGKPSILIPLPNAASNHQKENAFEFSKATGAVVLDQENLIPSLLLDQISTLLSNPQKLSEISQKSKTFYNPQTPELIRDEILKFKGSD
jgi:UDP-N-acetylglucosamine--N-acetylmuramyl-(pentapeptide) pyrophosphoryl-undecaprenol N-acetylglucosamine transferase